MRECPASHLPMSLRRLRLPIRCQLLRLFDLLWGHLGGDHVAILDGDITVHGVLVVLSRRKGCRRRKAEPHMRLDEVPRDAIAAGVHGAEASLRKGIAL